MNYAEFNAALNGACDPIDRGLWYGSFRSVDGADTDDFIYEDVAEVIYAGDDGSYCGTNAAILRLHDGRFVAYESFQDVTGSGFSADAYGGDSDIYFANTLDNAIRGGLTDESRRALGIPQPDGPMYHY